MGSTRAPPASHQWFLPMHFICSTCGTQYTASDRPPAVCSICQDARQYVAPGGQRWTTHDELRGKHRNALRQEEPGLLGIGIEPDFAIGQRALLVRTPQGNVLWDCVSLIDDGLVELLHAAGGVAAIAISHPHYYTSMVEWSRAFDAPLWLHAADRQWVMRPDPAIQFWQGDTQALPGGLTLVRAGGHFAGGTLLHWPAGAAGRGALLSGDIIQVVPDPRWVSFMYSYPNLIPLSAAKVQRIVASVEPFAYDRIYGAWWGRVVTADARRVVHDSAARYLAAIAEK